jgi:hypothetical protein
MSEQSDAVGQDEVIGFLNKLAEFRQTLEPGEQAILDEMTATALSSSGEVQGFALSAVPMLGDTLMQGGRVLKLPGLAYYRAVLNLVEGGRV